MRFAEDTTLDAPDAIDAYRALQDITEEAWPDNARLGREWYAAHGAGSTDRFRRFEGERK